jgi:hypothetical protein
MVHCAAAGLLRGASLAATRGTPADTTRCLRPRSIDAEILQHSNSTQCEWIPNA